MTQNSPLLQGSPIVLQCPINKPTSLAYLQRTKSRLARDEDDYEGKSVRRRSSIPYNSNRPAIMQCTEEEFLQDYCSFCSSQLGRRVTPDNWPDSVLNGLPLDVYALYKEVVTRGGFA